MRRATLGLYNTYDKLRLHEAHFRALARAAPLAKAFDMNLAIFGFPFEGDAMKIAKEVSERTTIGEGGKYLVELCREGKFLVFDFPNRGFPPQLGEVVSTTSKPDEKKRISIFEAMKMLSDRPILFLVGLGRKGLPEDVLETSKYHLELTGRGISLETCTAMGVLASSLWMGVKFLEGKHRW